MCTFYYHITDHFWVGAEQPAAPHKNWQEKLLNIGFYRYYVRHIFSWSWVPVVAKVVFNLAAA